MIQHPIFVAVMAAMQDAEEAGGPEGQEYLDLMRAIADEASERASVYEERLDAARTPCPTEAEDCPICRAIKDSTPGRGAQ